MSPSLLESLLKPPPVCANRAARVSEQGVTSRWPAVASQRSSATSWQRLLALTVHIHSLRACEHADFELRPVEALAHPPSWGSSEHLLRLTIDELGSLKSFYNHDNTTQELWLARPLTSISVEEMEARSSVISFVCAAPAGEGGFSFFSLTRGGGCSSGEEESRRFRRQPQRNSSALYSSAFYAFYGE